MHLLPLAGVLLVMTAVMLCSLPLRQHALTLELPILLTHYPDGTEVTQDIPRVVHKLVMHPDRSLQWNGSHVTEEGLILQLQSTRQDSPSPGLTFEPHGNAAYGDVVQLLNILHRSGVAPDHFCLKGMGQSQAFEQNRPGMPHDGLTADQACATGLARDTGWAF